MKKDHVLKDFFSYPIRFADFMNALFFDGHAIIHPCDLHPLDSREIFIGDFLSKERTHDVIMMWERKDFQAILILEAQSSVVATLTGREDILEKMKGDEGIVEMYSFWKDAENVGLKKGKLSVVLKLLEKLLGKLKPDLEMKIVNSKEETLDSIIIHIFEIHNEEDVLKWL